MVLRGNSRPRRRLVRVGFWSGLPHDPVPQRRGGIRHRCRRDPRCRHRRGSAGGAVTRSEPCAPPGRAPPVGPRRCEIDTALRISATVPGMPFALSRSQYGRPSSTTGGRHSHASPWAEAPAVGAGGDHHPPARSARARQHRPGPGQLADLIDLHPLSPLLGADSRHRPGHHDGRANRHSRVRTRRWPPKPRRSRQPDRSPGRRCIGSTSPRAPRRRTW